MARLLPKSLPGQIALLVAIALFVAQAINFAFLLRERREARFNAIIVPAVTRLADTHDHLTAPAPVVEPPRAPGRRREGRRFTGDPRSRVEIVATNPIEPGAPRRSDLEAIIRDGLQQTGFTPRAVIATIENVPEGVALPRMNPRRAERLRRWGGELRIAVQQADGRWLTSSSGWPRSERDVVGQLLAQTLILYIVVLIPLLLAGRRIARPLRTLAEASRNFRPGDGAPPVEERGPSDVRAVIAAHNALSTRVTAMLDEKDRMLGAIGHDLRTPLAALRVRIESVDDDDDRNRMADTIDEMNRTLDDILSLARLGRPSEPATDVDLAALIDAVVEDFRDLGNDVAFEEAPRLKMHLRPTLMRRAVRNLIENAIKYGDGAVAVRLVPDARAVAIEVADNGPGIPADKLIAVFDPFTRLETSRNRETGGIGLGLALARAIVRDVGGEIALANRTQGGLVATITLPRT